MKGFMKTLEAAIGTLVLLGIVTSMSAQFDAEGTPAEVSSLNQQLQSMDRNIIEEAVNQRNGSVIEQNLDPITLETDAAIIIWENTYNATSETSFSQNFEYNENSSNVELLVWGNNQQVSIDLNGEEVFNSQLSYERLSLQPKAGTNNLEFSNPSGSRIAYQLKHEKRFGSDVPSSENVYVIRRMFKQDHINSSEVNVYLWE